MKVKQIAMKKISVITLLFILLLILPLITRGSIAAVSISAPNEVVVGVEFQVKLTGLTVGNNYRVDAVHSDGNISRYLTASSATEYIGLIFKTEDSDGIVPISLNAADSSGTYAKINYPTNNASTYDTALVQVKSPADSLDSSFFLLILTPLLIIGIVFVIVKRFIQT